VDSLACRAVDGSPTGEGEALEEGPAVTAWLTGSAVHLVAELEAAGVALTVDIVAQGGTARPDRASKQTSHAADQRANLIERQTVAGRRRMQATVEKQFVDVDVAQPGDEVLIEQGRLERATRGSQATVKLAWGDGQRVGPQRVPAAFAECGWVRVGPDAAEAAWIRKNELPPIVKLPDDVGVWR